MCLKKKMLFWNVITQLSSSLWKKESTDEQQQYLALLTIRFVCLFTDGQLGIYFCLFKQWSLSFSE